MWTTVGDIAESNIGLTYKPSDICTNGIPVYRSNNIKNGHIDLAEVVRVSTKILDKQLLNKGDLLICARNGSRRLVGKNAIIQDLNEPTAFGAFMAVCRSIYNPWICLVLNTSYFDRYLDDSNSTTINQVTQSMLLAFPIPFPPKNEQNRIIKEAESLMSVVETINSNKDKLNTVIKQTKSKILDLAIHGKLAPQDPNDEPASELLKRINPKAEITWDNPHYGKLPKGWCLCKISSVVDIVNGKSQKNVESQTGKYPIYGSGGVIGKAMEYTCLAGSTIIGRKGTINHPIFVEENFWNVDTAFGMKANNQILEDKYFYCFCLSFDFSKLDKSSALPSLTKTAIGNQILPIPPLTEQHRIVAKIEELFVQLDKIEASL